MAQRKCDWTRVIELGATVASAIAAMGSWASSCQSSKSSLEAKTAAESSVRTQTETFNYLKAATMDLRSRGGFRYQPESKSSGPESEK